MPDDRPVRPSVFARARRGAELLGIGARAARDAVSEARHPTPEEPDDDPVVEEPGYEFVEAYRRHTTGLKESFDEDTAASLAVGGNYESMGKLQLACLKELGLRPEHDFVDVGCGSGRLATQLATYLQGSYVGTDVVADLVAYAREHCPRPDWRFEVVEDLALPVKDESADFVVFFSVLTHLLHEHCYLMLDEAKRALRPGGTIVATFLEFADEAHWTIFEHMVEVPVGRPPNQFCHRDDLRVWADHLGLEVVALRDGSHPIAIDEPLEFDDGRTFEGTAAFGQATAVFRKPETA